MRLTTDEVRHISLLARGGLTDDEIEQRRDQMSNILKNIDVLAEVDTEGVESTGHFVDMNSVMRDDQIGASVPIEEALANAPRREGDLIRVKAVLEQ